MVIRTEAADVFHIMYANLIVCIPNFGVREC